ncbi:glycosyl hydrolase [uncultured Alistipes sp.]|uniref:glycosyl hydrolase n=1 Tax=uncultured Alistipes sp. TaxID=538949 RepID=UPI0025EAC540|nr:glycosyl hydrolase [uncultured Alistipes sp.]
MKIKVLLGTLLLVCSLAACQKKNQGISFDRLEAGFRKVPDSIRLAAYWYWLSDHISKEGVEKDLEAMKRAGITRAFIGNIGLDNLGSGPHKILTPGWWSVTHAALKKATELDIEIGMFNSPGWSQSGGPWVEPGQSMRYLASADIRVKGPTVLKTRLPEVGADAQDVKVLAYPDRSSGLFEKTWTLQKEDGRSIVADMQLPSEEIIRNISVTPHSAFKTKVRFLVKEGAGYKLLKEFEVDRGNTALNVGFDPLAPVVISVPGTRASTFRVELSSEGRGDVDVTLSSRPLIERYPEKTLAKMFPSPLPLWHDYMWEAQPAVSERDLLIAPEDILDVTSALSDDGMLEWTVPEGDWIVSRYAMLTTRVTNSPASPEATGLEVDKMSKEHVAAHFDAYIGEVLRRIPEADRKSFKVVVQDSYETGGQNWTDDMIGKFRSVYGYDPVPYMPVLNGQVVGSRDISDRFLWDLRRLVADRVAYDYVGGLREICHKHGLTTWLENYGHWGFPGEFLMYGGQSDEIGGEFWSEGSLGDIENRAASSSAHIYGKSRVWAESFTSAGPNFGRHPATMKQRGDRFFTEGINATLLHLYIHQPYEDKNPGMSAWFGNDFHRKNTWFSHMDLFSTYLRRVNFMLQQGRYVADVAYFIGEDAPKMTGVCDPPLPEGYSFDYINAEVLLNYASVENGRLKLASGMEYSLLVLPRQRTMRPEVLRKIGELVKEGLTVTGPAPDSSPSLAGYPDADARVRELADRLWQDKKRFTTYGKGRVFPAGYTIGQIFDQLNIDPDFSIPAGDDPVLFIHRAMEQGDFYFVSNQSDRKISIAATFRVNGYRPELWNPLTGEIRQLPQYTQQHQATSLPLELDAYESCFVVFRKKAAPADDVELNFPRKEVLCTVDTPWTVRFEPGKRGPESPVVFDRLVDWSSMGDEKIRYFSGEAVYSTSFTLDKLPAEEMYIDLGKVMVMAKVTLNGRYVGGVWTSPYRLNITDYLKDGENQLEVTVVNNWQNRLIGDQHLSEKERPTWTPVNPWRADSPLQPSGLLGPVEIQAYPYRVLK